MYKNDTLNRYQLFLNETIELANAGALTSLSALRSKYGVSGALLGFMKAKKIISAPESGTQHAYIAIRKNPFEVAETQMFIAEFNRWKLNDKTAKDIIANDHVIIKKGPKKGSCLAECTTRELFAELKRRGYTGTLTIQKEITI